MVYLIINMGKIKFLLVRQWGRVDFPGLDEWIFLALDYVFDHSIFCDS